MMILLFAVTACQSTKIIVNSLDEQDANEILVLLAQEHIPAYKILQPVAVGGGGGRQILLWDIAVSSQNAERALEILSANGLPRRQSQNLIDLFSAGGLVPSDLSEKIRYQVGLADSIANVIRKMDGIVDADVRLSFPEEDPLNPLAKLGPTTASVYVKHTGVLDDPNSHLSSKIRQLVSSAVSGLSYNNVTVIPDRARFAIQSSAVQQVAPREYVSVLGFVIAKSSLRDFEIFFSCICLLIIILVLSFWWLLWKIYPLLKKRGGIIHLFSLTPVPDTLEQQLPTQEVNEISKDESKPTEESKSPKIQENIEEE